MAKRQEDEPPKGAPAWQSTFADLMNLLLCFFVLLFSMSTIDAEKYEQVVASLSQTFSIFSGGATVIGDGVLISNGVSQLNELDEYINSTGKTAENDQKAEEFDDIQQIIDELNEQKLSESERLAEMIQEAVNENNLSNQVDVTFDTDGVILTLKGALLFDSGRADLKDEALPVLAKVGKILERYASNTIDVEGHTDNVPMTNGRYANNNELSDARALAVFDYLTENTSLEPASIIHSGRGEYVPVADNSTAEGRAMNRRVEIKIYNFLSSR